MTGRIGAKGQIVVPKWIRERTSLEPGDEVDIDLVEDAIVVRPRRSPRRLAGRFARTGMAERLLAERRAEPR